MGAKALVAIAGAGGSIAYASAILVRASEPLLVALLAAAVTMFSYVVDRTLDPTGFIDRRWLGATAMSWLAMALVLAAKGHPLPALFTVVFPLSVLLYVAPILPRARRVKDLPFTKPLYVAFMWAQLVVLASLFASELSPWLVLATATWLFVKVTVNAAACDFKDVREDRARGVGSWPVLLGWRRALHVLHALNFLGALPLLFACAAGLVPRSFALFELLAVHYAVCLLVIGRVRASAKPVALALDAGTFVLVVSAVTMRADSSTFGRWAPRTTSAPPTRTRSCGGSSTMGDSSSPRHLPPLGSST